MPGQIAVFKSKYTQLKLRTENPQQKTGERAESLSELGENEARILKALQESGGNATPFILAQRSGLADSAVARAILNLSSRGLIKELVEKRTEIQATQEGEQYVTKGLPERQVAKIIVQSGGHLNPKEAVERTGLSPDYIPIVTGWLTRKKWGRLEKKDSQTELIVEKDPERDDDEEVLALIDHKVLTQEELPNELTFSIIRLIRRNILESREKSDRRVEITQMGIEAALATSFTAPKTEVSNLTGDMIASGEWERVQLRTYNVSSNVPNIWPGRLHPYAKFLRNAKQQLIGLGFQEVTGPLVEYAFINCDCLYMPQDHPAREVHDLFYLKEPNKGDLSIWNGTVDRVEETHENGDKTGSRGWRYAYSRQEAARLIMRSHGTALSVRAMLSKNVKIPGKYFAVARCYRPDPLDKTHLMEFNQVEGIIIDPSLNLRNLLGVLEMFAKEIAGADKVRFKPDYFPFTEPSVELQAYKDGYGWVEFGGSGIFRPEVTIPLGIKAQVLAWGLGIDRLYMMNKRISDIRQLFSPDLEWIRQQKVD